MKRGQLKTDPAKVAAFVQRGRVRAAENARKRGRAPLERSVALVRRVTHRPPEGPLSPSEWHEAAFRRAGGRCEVKPGERAFGAVDERFHAHHVIPKQRLRKEGCYGLVWDQRNALWIGATVHMSHEFAAIGEHRIPATAIRLETWQFAAECGEWAVRILQDARVYPTQGAQ